MRKEVIGACELYLGDCMDIMPTLGKVDAVVTDPPYGYGYKPNRNGSINSASFKRNFGPEDILIGDTGNMDFDPRPFLPIAEEHIWWGGNCYSDKLPNEKGWLVWFKADGNTKIDQGHAELAWTNLGCAIRGLNHRWCGMVKDSERGDTALHPTQKPIAVMEWCLSYIDGQIVFDPFMGSGTTGVACVKKKKTFIGCEMSEKYFDIACRRIEEAYKQPDMFIEPPSKPVQEKLI